MDSRVKAKFSLESPVNSVTLDRPTGLQGRTALLCRCPHQACGLSANGCHCSELPEDPELGPEDTG